MNDSIKDMYKFKKPLIKAKIIKRNSQFTATVSLNGEIIIVSGEHNLPSAHISGQIFTDNMVQIIWEIIPFKWSEISLYKLDLYM